MVIKDDFFFFDVQIYGPAAFSVAALVAVKQVEILVYYFSLDFYRITSFFMFLWH